MHTTPSGNNVQFSSSRAVTQSCTPRISWLLMPMALTLSAAPIMSGDEFSFSSRPLPLETVPRISSNFWVPALAPWKRRCLPKSSSKFSRSSRSSPMSAAIVVRKQAASFCSTGRVDGVPVASVQLRSTGLLMYDIYTSNCSTSGVFRAFCAAEFVCGQVRVYRAFREKSRRGC